MKLIKLNSAYLKRYAVELDNGSWMSNKHPNESMLWPNDKLKYCTFYTRRGALDAVDAWARNILEAKDAGNDKVQYTVIRELGEG